ncbi:glycosyltransferase family 4 protein [Cyanobium sp. FGCU-52]|nr:glycosyltransferase family 4 protein [Cyanobium sp. FGCU52]
MPEIPPNHLHAIPLAGDSVTDHSAKSDGWDVFCQHFKISEDDQLLLSVGTIEPRKNHYHLLKGFELATRELRDVQLRLIIVGALGWHYDPILQAISESPVADRIILLGSIPDALLGCLYQKAFATIFVSWGEGFGLPVLESMTYGTPVISSSVPALSELAQGAAYFVNPASIGEIGAAITALGVSTQLRDKLSLLGSARAKTYSWNNTVGATARLYKQLLAN